MALRKNKYWTIKHYICTLKTICDTKPTKTGGELRCSGRLSSSCSTSDIRRITVKRASSNMDIVLDTSIHK